MSSFSSLLGSARLESPPAVRASLRSLCCRLPPAAALLKPLVRRSDLTEHVRADRPARSHRYNSHTFTPEAERTCLHRSSLCTSDEEERFHNHFLKMWYLWWSTLGTCTCLRISISCNLKIKHFINRDTILSIKQTRK